MITTSKELAALLAEAPAGDDSIFAIDTEADSMYRYEERLCLIQYYDGKNLTLIDPLEVEDIKPLIEFLMSRRLWMHGADYDMTLFKRKFGMIPTRIFDTQIAARLIGVSKFGYANLVEQFFGVQLCKSSQKEDWGRRPIPEKMQEYALNDVRYLPPMAEMLTERLEELGRFEWFLESCDHAREKVSQRSIEKIDPWKIAGSGKFSIKELAFLRELWKWREEEARVWDRPSYMVASNKALIAWVPLLLEGGKPSYPRNIRGSRMDKLNQAVARFRELDPSDYPQKVKRKQRVWHEDYDERFEELSKKRNEVAQSLSLDPSLIASRAVLEKICLGAPEEELGMMKWQKELLGL